MFLAIFQPNAKNSVRSFSLTPTHQAADTSGHGLALGQTNIVCACVLLGLVLLGLQGCASIDFEYPRESAHVISDGTDTLVGRHIEPLTHGQAANESGFYPMGNGIDALAVRLLLAQRAEKSIDVQYYLIKDDIVGRAFVGALLQAADRGVRVRLLLDDMFTSGYDAGIAALDSHPNFEIRIFNPFNRGAVGRLGAAITDFARINRRMHNKSFTIDNSMTLIGGRNIANEYFGADEDAAFGDLDVLGIGPVVQGVSHMFDQYWNHETALPVAAIVTTSAAASSADTPDTGDAAALGELRARLKESHERIRQSKYALAVRDKRFDYLVDGASIFNWAPYELVYDSPDKGIGAQAADASSITDPLVESLRRAKSEAYIISPYFVPRKSGIAALEAMQASGVDVTIVTNSLAANNQFAVHGGYGPSRKPLLRSGISIYEIRPDAEVAGTEFVDTNEATSTLHTKAFIIDRKEVFIGSFNFDPRSANINTELGVIIHDPILGEFYAERLKASYRDSAYQVFLDGKNRVRWRGFDDDREVIYKKEPETSWFLRLKVGFVRWLPIRGQL